MLVSGVLSLLQGKPLRLVCQQWYVWFLPFYLIGAVVVGLLPLSDHVPAPEGWLILLPLLYLVHFFCAVSSGRRSSFLATDEPPGQMLSRTAQFSMDLVIRPGATLLIYALSHWQCQNLNRFMAYLGMALVAATFKVRLPGLTSMISFSFVLMLVAIAESDISRKTLISLAAIATVVQIIWRPQRSPRPISIPDSVQRRVHGGQRLYRIRGLSGRFGVHPNVLVGCTSGNCDDIPLWQQHPDCGRGKCV